MGLLTVTVLQKLALEHQATSSRPSSSWAPIPIVVRFNVNFVWHSLVLKVPTQFRHSIDAAHKPYQLHLLQLQKFQFSHNF